MKKIEIKAIILATILCFVLFWIIGTAVYYLITMS